jgi:hypothetical protein
MADTGMTALYLRDREALEEIITQESAGERCTYCKRPIAQGMFHWLDEAGSPQRMGDPVSPGAVMRFSDWRHADGTPGHGDDGDLVLPDTSRCPQCKAFGVITVRDTGYGSDCTCTACGWSKYFDRGD